MMEKFGLGATLRSFKAWNGILALCYHRVGIQSTARFERTVWSTDPTQFDDQVSFLKRHFDVIVPADLSATVKSRRGRYILITFDDGYRDNYIEAFPILQSHGVGATFFVTTGFLDRPQVSAWDEIAWMARASTRLEVPAGPWLEAPVTLDEPERDKGVATLQARYKSLPGDQTAAYLDYLAEATGSGRCSALNLAETWMTWDMIREMKTAGMCIGGHTVNHPVLARIPRERQLQEITECGRRLQKELGDSMTCFSYPVGSPEAFNEDTQSCLREAGVTFAFSYYGGFNRFDEWDPFDIRRASVDQELDTPRFRAITTFPQLFSRF
jgi:peptidoglycan/xylan/chitin deacetylase (PgdA/CDA1 family)